MRFLWVRCGGCVLGLWMGWTALAAGQVAGGGAGQDVAPAAGQGGLQGVVPAAGQVSGQVAGQVSGSGEVPAGMLRVTSRVVAISAVVKSRDGQPRTGLTKEDFLLKQDGKEEPIRYFSQGSDLPLSIVLMVDVSNSQRTFIGDESLASDVFFQTMMGREQDRAMLVQFDAAVTPLSPMTNAPNVLHLGLTRLGTRPAMAGATLLNDGVDAIANQVLAREKGRKAIILLTDGGDNGSRKSTLQAIEQAQRADVQIYSIFYSVGEGFGPARPGFGSGAGGGDLGLKTLQQFSESTGGRVFAVTRGVGLRKIYEQIEQDLRLQYELGYTPPPDTPPNTYHRLELRPKDRGLTVQARKGFFAKP